MTFNAKTVRAITDSANGAGAMEDAQDRIAEAAGEGQSEVRLRGAFWTDPETVGYKTVVRQLRELGFVVEFCSDLTSDDTFTLIEW